jgi:hypothetical protein
MVYRLRRLRQMATQITCGPFCSSGVLLGESASLERVMNVRRLRRLTLSMTGTMVRRLRRFPQITCGLFCSSGGLSCMPAPRADPHAGGRPSHRGQPLTPRAAPYAKGSLRARYPASPRYPQIPRIHNQRNQRTLCTSFFNGPQITQINADYARPILLIRRTFVYARAEGRPSRRGQPLTPRAAPYAKGRPSHRGQPLTPRADPYAEGRPSRRGQTLTPGAAPYTEGRPSRRGQTLTPGGSPLHRGQPLTPGAAPYAKGSPRARYPASPRYPQIPRIHNLRNLRNLRTL